MREFFPSVLNVKNKKCLVAGSDAEAVWKASSLKKSQADVVLIGEAVSKADRKKLKRLSIILDKRPFRLSDIKNQFLVVLSKDLEESLVRKAVSRCRRKKILTCAIDRTELCDIINVSVFERGPLKIMISTGGVAPAVAKKIRKTLEKSFPVSATAQFFKKFQKFRQDLEKSIPDLTIRRKKLIAEAQKFGIEINVKIPK